MADRREFIRRMAVSAAFFGVLAVGAGELFSLLGQKPPQQLTLQQTTQQLVTGQTSQQTTQQASQTQSSQQQAPAGYVFLAPLSALSGKTYAYFAHPKYGDSIILNYGGSWKAFSAICTHAGCTVDFTGSSIYCACHAGYFSPTNGAVQGGPPPTPLSQFGVVVQNGNVYVSEAVIN